jgi:TolB-like protein/Tfp pilus assembly protein PilF
MHVSGLSSEPFSGRFRIADGLRMDGKKQIAAAVKDYIARERISREQFAFKTRLGKSTVDKFLVGLFSDRTLAVVEEHTRLALRPLLGGASLEPFEPAEPPADAAAARPALDRPTIAVLALENMSGDPDQEYFADGIAEDIITALSRLRGFFVVARNSSFSYKGRAVEVRRIARELAVQYVLEGSVRKAGNRVRITLQLIDAVEDKHLWSEKFDRELTDIFAVQDEIARAVASAAEPSLYQAESARAARVPTRDMRAWDYTIRALPSIWRFSGPDTAIAEKLLDVAVAYDPEYGFAQSLRGFVLALRTHMGWEQEVAAARQKARAAATRAVVLDPGDAWAHLALGYSHMLVRETADAVAQLEAATRLNPSSAMAYMVLAMAHNHGGNADAGRRAIDEAMLLSPRDPMMTWFSAIRATSEFVAGNYAESLVWARKALRESADNPSAARSTVIAHAMMGELDKAQAMLARVREIQPGISLDYVENVQLFSDPETRARYVGAFKLAGLT